MVHSLEYLLKEIEIQDGDLDISGQHDITGLPNGLVVNGFLDINHTSISKLPDDIEICIGLDASNTPLEKLPPDLILNYLDISNTHIKSLPKRLQIEGQFWAVNTPIQELPNDFILDGCEIHCSADSPLVNLAFEGYKIYIEKS